MKDKLNAILATLYKEIVPLSSANVSKVGMYIDTQNIGTTAYPKPFHTAGFYGTLVGFHETRWLPSTVYGSGDKVSFPLCTCDGFGATPKVVRAKLPNASKVNRILGEQPLDCAGCFFNTVQRYKVESDGYDSSLPKCNMKYNLALFGIPVYSIDNVSNPSDVGEDFALWYFSMGYPTLQSFGKISELSKVGWRGFHITGSTPANGAIAPMDEFIAYKVSEIITEKFGDKDALTAMVKERIEEVVVSLMGTDCRKIISNAHNAAVSLNDKITEFFG